MPSAKASEPVTRTPKGCENWKGVWLFSPPHRYSDRKPDSGWLVIGLRV